MDTISGTLFSSLRLRGGITTRMIGGTRKIIEEVQNRTGYIPGECQCLNTYYNETSVTDRGQAPPRGSVESHAGLNAGGIPGKNLPRGKFASRRMRLQK
jgi:hypothetical protein